MKSPGRISRSCDPPPPAPGYPANQGRIRGDITGALREWHDNPAALERLIPEVVEELRRLARGCFLRESPGHTLQPTALVNEVYLRLSHNEVGELHDRGQFFAFAARLMRQILVDHARARRTEKRGGPSQPLSLEAIREISANRSLDPDALLVLDQALDRLAELDPRQRTIVELRFFTGSTLPEIAEYLDVSLTTVERSWRVARRWLARELR